MHRILILGPQGSGKGTQANKLSEKLGIPALSMGNLLREEVDSGSGLGREIDEIIHGRGELVPDDVALEVLKRRLNREDCSNGYILDGYPRNAAQYEAAQALEDPTAVLVITVPKEESLARMLKRAEIEARADDTPEIIEKRLSIYHQDTEPVIEKYKARGLVHEIDGMGGIEEVAKKINAALNV